MQPNCFKLTRHVETNAFELYSAVLLKDGHYFALMAPTTAELEILWVEIAEKPLDFKEVQHVAVVRYSREDEEKKNPKRCTMDPNSCKVDYCPWPSCTEPGLR